MNKNKFEPPCFTNKSSEDKKLGRAGSSTLSGDTCVVSTISKKDRKKIKKDVGIHPNLNKKGVRKVYGKAQQKPLFQPFDNVDVECPEYAAKKRDKRNKYATAATHPLILKFVWYIFMLLCSMYSVYIITYMPSFILTWANTVQTCISMFKGCITSRIRMFVGSLKHTRWRTTYIAGCKDKIYYGVFNGRVYYNTLVNIIKQLSTNIIQRVRTLPKQCVYNCMSMFKRFMGDVSQYIIFRCISIIEYAAHMTYFTTFSMWIAYFASNLMQNVIGLQTRDEPVVALYVSLAFITPLLEECIKVMMGLGFVLITGSPYIASYMFAAWTFSIYEFIVYIYHLWPVYGYKSIIYRIPGLIFHVAISKVSFIVRCIYHVTWNFISVSLSPRATLMPDGQPAPTQPVTPVAASLFGSGVTTREVGQLAEFSVSILAHLKLLYHASSSVDFVLQLYVFLRSFIANQGVVDDGIIDSIVKFIVSCSIQETTPETQLREKKDDKLKHEAVIPRGVFDTLTGILAGKNKDIITSSAMYNNVTSLFTSTIIAPICIMLGFTPDFKTFNDWMSKFTIKRDLLLNASYISGIVLEFVYSGIAYMTAPPELRSLTMLFKPDAWSRFINESNEIINNYTNMPFMVERGYMTNTCAYRDELLVKVKSLIAQGNAMCANLSNQGDQFKAASLLRITTSLQSILGVIQANQVANQHRKPPAAFMLYGDPQTQKTMLATAICNIISFVHGRQFKDSDIFTVNDSLKHADGFDNHKFFNFEDMGSVVAADTQMGAIDFIKLVGAAGYQLPSAFLETKGKLIADPLGVIVSTNDKTAGFLNRFHNIAAAMRRFTAVLTTGYKSAFRDKTRPRYQAPSAYPDNDDVLSIMLIKIELVRILNDNHYVLYNHKTGTMGPAVPGNDGDIVDEGNAYDAYEALAIIEQLVRDQITKESHSLDTRKIVGDSRVCIHGKLQYMCMTCKNELYVRCIHNNNHVHCDLCARGPITQLGEAIQDDNTNIMSETQIVIYQAPVPMSIRFKITMLFYMAWLYILRFINWIRVNILACRSWTQSYLMTGINDSVKTYGEYLAGRFLDNLRNRAMGKATAWAKVIIPIIVILYVFKQWLTKYDCLPEQQVKEQLTEEVREKFNFMNTSVGEAITEPPSYAKITSRIDWDKKQHEYNLPKQPSNKVEAIKEQVRRNTVVLKFQQPGEKEDIGQGLVLTGNSILVCAHELRKITNNNWTVDVSFPNDSKSINKNTAVMIKPDLIKRHKSKDYAVITLPQLLPSTNILPYFAVEDVTQTISSSNNFFCDAIKGCETVDFIKCNWDMGKTEKEAVTPGFKYKLSYIPQGGQSGAPLIWMKNGAARIIGLHSVMYNGCGMTRVITLGEINELLEDPIIMSDVATDLNTPVEQLSERSVLYHIKSGVGEVIGTCPKLHVAKPVSHLKPSPLYDDYPTPLVRPILTPFVIPADPPVYVDPYLNTIGTILNRQRIININAAEMAFEQLFDFYEEIGVDFSLLKIQDAHTAIRGIAGYNKSINRSTSSGTRISGVKHEHMFEDFDGRWITDLEVTNEVLRVLDLLDQGISPNFFARLSPKDELITPEKLYNAEVRMFNTCEIAMIIVIRMFYGSWFDCVADFRDKGHCAVGINIASLELETLIHDLCMRPGFSPDILMAKDNVKYDKNQQLIIMYYGCLNRRLCKLNEKFLIKRRSLKALAGSISFPVMIVKSDLIRVGGIQCSGIPGTTVVNSDCEIGYELLVFHLLVTYENNLQLVTWEPKSFGKYWYWWNYIRFKTYGDDNIVAAHESILDRYKVELLKPAFALLNMPITADDKTKEIAWQSITDVTFLKRHFRLVKNVRLGDQVRDIWTAPLALKSINKSLAWMDESILSDSDYMRAVIEGALMAYWMYGETEYNIYKKQLMQCVIHMIKNNVNYSAMQIVWYSYDDITELYMADVSNIIQEVIAPEEANTQLLTDFVDTEPTVIGERIVPMKELLPDPSINQLLDFLQTPLFVGTYASDSTYVIDPYSLILTNLVVRRKLRNFANIMADISVEFRVSGQPFVYGRTLCYWYTTYATGTRTHNVQLMNFQHLLLNPSVQETKSLYIVYPERLPITLADTTTPTSITRVGIKPFVIYNNSQDTVVPIIQISAFISLRNVKLGQLVPELQSKKGGTQKVIDKIQELHTNKTISKTATSVSNFLGGVAKIPIIGSLAGPLSGAASVFAKAADWFGFSKPPNLLDIQQTAELPYKNISVDGVLDNSERAFLDPKGGFPIYGAMVSGQDKDEMAFAAIWSRPSYIGSFSMAYTQAYNTLLKSYAVSPGGVIYSGGGIFNPTNIAFVSSMFALWRGSIVYTITPVCSAFHRGKVRLYWSPHSDPALDENPSNSVPNVIIDLAEQKAVQIVVAWGYGLYWRSPRLFDVDTLPVIGNGLNNGYLHCTVIEPLTAPRPAAAVWFIVQISAGPDFEVNRPTMNMLQEMHERPITDTSNALTPTLVTTFDPSATSSVLTDADVPIPQSLESDTTLVSVTLGQVDQTPEISSITCGESFWSFRSLLHRMVFSYWPHVSGSYQTFFVPRDPPIRNIGSKVNHHPISYVSSAYTYNTGCTRALIFPLMNAVQADVVLTIVSGLSAVSNSYAATETYDYNNGDASASRFDLHGITFKVRSPYLVELKGLQVSGRFVCAYTNNNVLNHEGAWVMPMEDASTLRFRVSYSTADDYDLQLYIGPPQWFQYSVGTAAPAMMMTDESEEMVTLAAPRKVTVRKLGEVEISSMTPLLNEANTKRDSVVGRMINKLYALRSGTTDQHISDDATFSNIDKEKVIKEFKTVYQSGKYKPLPKTTPETDDTFVKYKIMFPELIQDKDITVDNPLHVKPPPG